MGKEAVLLETLPIAQVAKNSEGIVIAKVERLTERGSLNPRNVKIPGILVDAVVVVEKENHPMFFTMEYNPAYSHELRIAKNETPNLKLDECKVIARRNAWKLKLGNIVNLGIGCLMQLAQLLLKKILMIIYF